MKKLLYVLTAAVALAAAPAPLAGTITVRLVWEDGSKCGNTCKISNDYNWKETCTDGGGIAQVDVGDATRKVQVYVGGTAAVCARAGDSVTVTVKGSGVTGSGVVPAREGRCD